MNNSRALRFGSNLIQQDHLRFCEGVGFQAVLRSNRRNDTWDPLGQTGGKKQRKPGKVPGLYSSVSLGLPTHDPLARSSACSTFWGASFQQGQNTQNPCPGGLRHRHCGLRHQWKPRIFRRFPHAFRSDTPFPRTLPSGIPLQRGVAPQIGGMGQAPKGGLPWAAATGSETDVILRISAKLTTRHGPHVEKPATSLG